ncbi:2OG-Fe(II) oxygenase [Xenorhabdus budapestensis]|uniref:2OG-Fe(II) oxygenase n=1 Tax=Xenorhabdus budapestensis TaxID=290110 RepID=A0ABX7VHL2_XENBU|nr:2OG-Fe(II) oxygenase [Xenorhabdus budapestensis]QTL39406.1 2OG-Fe(II) oxygenase [Xenorhabdus budapestensis]
MLFWKSTSTNILNSRNLKAVIDNQIPALIIADFATRQESFNFSQTVLKKKTIAYEFGRPGSYLGVSLAHYRNSSKEKYFTKVKEAEEQRLEIIKQSFDPVARFFQYINQQTDYSISVANESTFGSYFAGIIRVISHGTDPHVDYAPTFTKGELIVGEISTQLAWNFYASSPEEGGETVVYNQPYTFSGINKTYEAYDTQLLEECESYTFKPTVGSVVIFNTMNPHIVLPATQKAKIPRIATGSFLGLLRPNQIIAWS